MEAESPIAGKAETGSSRVGTTATELTREQLLEFIKKLKAKMKRMEKEHDQYILAAAQQSREAVERRVSPGEVVSQSPHSPAPACLFWEMIQHETLQVQRLAKLALRRLLNKSFSEEVNSEKVGAAFGRWKANILHAKLDEAVRNVTTLEQRCAKLKGLLSRTHQASKQQAEDTNAFKRAQRETSQELRTHAQEKLALIEEVRARDIEFAFHQDLELFIQKAAEGVALAQRQQFQEAQMQKPKSDSCTEAAALAAQAQLQAQAQALQESQAREADLSARLAELRLQSAKADKGAAVLQARVRDMGALQTRLEKQVADESSARRDLEVELDITLRNRAEILREVEGVAEAKLLQYQQESEKNTVALTAQCAGLERQLAAALASAASLGEENTRLRRAAQAMDNTNEVAILRTRLAEYKALVKGSEHSLSQIVDLAKFFAKQATSSAEAMQARALVASSLSKYVCRLHEKVIQMASVVLAPYVAGGGPGQTLRPPCESELQSQRAAVDALTAQLAALDSAQSAGGPMVWEATSVTVQAGKDIAFAIPMPKSPSPAAAASAPRGGARGPLPPTRTATLEWTYSGPHASFVSLTLASPAGSVLPALSLQSVQGHGPKSHEYQGRHSLSCSEGDRILKLGTSSMWGPVTLSYFFRLSLEESACDASRVELAASLDKARRDLDALEARIARAAQPLQTLSRLSAQAAKVADAGLALDHHPDADDDMVVGVDGLERLRAEARRLDALCGAASHLWPSRRGAVSVQKEGGGGGSSPGEGSVGKTFVASTSPDTLSVLNCESLCLRASDDFRVYIPPSLMPRPLRLRWSVELLSKNLDVGFTILEQQEDGALPTLIPYRRIKGQSSEEIVVTGDTAATLVVLLDNTYSWARSKELRCSVQVSPADEEQQHGVGGGGDVLAATRLAFPLSASSVDGLLAEDALSDLVQSIIELQT